MSKLALGTAQFGLRYGVANRHGRVGLDAVAAILRRASNAGMDTLDTAIGYGDSEANLGRVGVGGWRIVTKLPAYDGDSGNVRAWVEGHILASMRRLGVEQLEAVLVHRSGDLLGERGHDLVDALRVIKRDGLARSIGVSIYAPGELDEVCAFWQPDIVQAPCNVFDRRLVTSGWLHELTMTGVRVHVRSVFLQGLLLMQYEERPRWLARWEGLVDRWFDWCREQGTTPLRAAVAAVAVLPGVERIIVGVDSLNQLDEILSCVEGGAPLAPAELSSEDLNLIDPRRWKVQ